MPAPQIAAGRSAEAGSQAGLGAPEGAIGAQDVSREEAPRAFVVELDRAWRAGDLRDSELRLLRDLLSHHPLPWPD